MPSRRGGGRICAGLAALALISLLSLSYRREDGSELDSNGYAVSVTYRGAPKR